MKVLHLATGNMFGGIETLLVTLAKLEARGSSLQNHYLLSHNGRLADELKAAQRPTWIVEGARLRKPWAIRRARAAAQRLVQQLQPDVVLAHGPWAYFVFGHGVQGASVPLGFFQHGLASKDVLHRLAALRPPSFIVANSSTTAATVGTIFGHCRVMTCPCPVLSPVSTVPRDSTRYGFGAGAHDVVVLQTSRLEAAKGHLLLLEALLALPQLPWVLWYAGGCSRRSEMRLKLQLEALAGARGLEPRVVFLGERTDVGDLLRAADIFCQPSVTREGYGIGLVEAMSHGLPIVVTEEGATADSMVRTFGRVVEANAAALSGALKDLILSSEERQVLGLAAGARYLDHHSPDQAVARLEVLLGELAESQRGHRGTAPAWV